MQTETTKTPKIAKLNPKFVKGEPVKLDNKQRAAMLNAQEMLRSALAGAKNFGTLSGGTLGDIMGAPLEMLPSVFSSFQDFQLPMTANEFDERFPPEFSLINDTATQQSTGLLSKFVGAGSPVAPFIVRAVCLVARCDYEAWALVGAGITPPAAANTPPPRVPRVVPVGGLPDDPEAVPAVFEYNRTAIRGLFDLLQSEQLQYLVSGRLLLINERAFDVGSVDANACVRGFGTGLGDPRLIINEANKHFVDMGSDFIFADPTVTSTDRNADTIEPNLVDLQYATPYLPGVFGQCYPVKPHILLPGMNYQFLMVRRNTERNYFERLRQEWTTPSGLLKIDDNYADSRAADANGPAVWGGHLPFYYSRVQFGMLLRGCEMIPQECLRWFLMFGQPYWSLMDTTPGMRQSLDALVAQCGLSGVPRPLGLYGEDPRWQTAKKSIEVLYNARRDSSGGLAGFTVSDQPCSLDELTNALKDLLEKRA